MAEEDPTPVQWSAYEYPYERKGGDWYWALGIVVVSFAIAAYLFGNMLFGILILVAGFTVALYGAKPPELLHCEVNKRGVKVNNRVYPYGELRSFWVDEETLPPKLILRSEKVLMPHIIIPLGDANGEDIREFLSEKLSEEEMQEPLSHKIAELLGF